jgi:hypothetical protein
MRNRLLALVMACVPAVANAQAQESTDAQLRNDCRLATQVLTTGRPATHRAWALQVVDRCDDTGPSALARAWSGVAPTGADVTELMVPSVRLWDQRLFSVLSSVARDRAQHELKRVAALSVLATYAAPNSAMSLSELLDPRPDPTRAVRLTSVDHQPRTIGTQPLPGSVTDDVARLVRGLISAEPESKVGVAASRLLRYVLVQN